MFGYSPRYWCCFSVIVLGLGLSSCEGSRWGIQIERALAPGQTGEIAGERSPTPDPESTPTPEPTIVPEPIAGDDVSPSNAVSPELTVSATPQTSDSESTAPISEPSELSVSASQFRDLGQAPTLLQRPLEEVIALGVITTTAKAETSGEDSQALFEPNKPVTRREFARWLVNANNAIYQERPAQQIRLASTIEQPIFQDLPATDPDFVSIQGLASAGFIPSPLTGATTTVQFKPDEPLDRQTLVLWKVAIETEQRLPTASLDLVQNTWGFQDAAQINGPALGAVFVDSQNGDLSNIRRLFGSTTLFQPQKAVTRAEAVSALWFFGSQGQGISAVDLLR